MRLKSVSKYGTSSASRNSDNDFNESNNGVDDLDLDSGDDEIDVGTNADSMSYNGKNANSSNNTNSNSELSFGNGTGSGLTEADRKRAHHNALERKRRDHIKDSFHTLRDAIPNIKGEKTSRAQILKAATDYIKLMRNRNIDFQQDIDSLKKQNNEIEYQIRQLEKAKAIKSEND